MVRWLALSLECTNTPPPPPPPSPSPMNASRRAYAFGTVDASLQNTSSVPWLPFFYHPPLPPSPFAYKPAKGDGGSRGWLKNGSQGTEEVFWSEASTVQNAYTLQDAFMGDGDGGGRGVCSCIQEKVPANGPFFPNPK